MLFHAVQPPLVSSDYGLTVDMMRAALLASQETAAKRLEHLRAMVKKKGVDVTTRLVDGFPAGNIVEWARKLKVAYVVMGTHGHTAVYELLVGSTTHAVLKNTPCPVLIVPPPPKKNHRKKTRKPKSSH